MHHSAHQRTLAEATSLQHSTAAPDEGGAPRTNLVLPRSPLIGRDSLLHAVEQLLQQEQVGLLTLTGTGGIAKTRLALQMAADVLEHFADGVFVVSLAPVGSPDLVLPAIAQVLGVRETGPGALRMDVSQHLRGRELLLVLDNFEHVRSAAPDVAALLQVCPRLKVLVTSRATLHLYGEHEFPVPPLTLPAPKALAAFKPGMEHSLRDCAAVELFCRRAAAVQPGFALTPDNALTVARICTGLDGLPLAIELAAARVKLFAPPALLARLQERLVLLTGGAHDLPARQRTLRDEIAWSYNLLHPEEQVLFRRLAVFAGGFTLEAAQAVGKMLEAARLDVLDLVAGLIDQNLLRQLEEAGDLPRFGMLETIRAYALEQLDGSGEGEAARYAHASYFLAFATAGDLEMGQSATRERAIARLQADFANLRAAFTWSLQARPADFRAPEGTGADETAPPAFMHPAEIGLRLAGVLTWFALQGDHVGEVRGWALAALSNPFLPADARAQAFWGAGFLSFVLGDFPHARGDLEQSVALYREIGDREGLATALRELCIVAYCQRELSLAQRTGEQSVALFRTLDNKGALVVALDNLGVTLATQGKYADARLLFEEAHEYSRQLGEATLLSICLVSLGWIAALQGDDATALTYLEQTLAIRRALGEKWTVAETLNLMGEIAQRNGDDAQAESLYVEALMLAHEVGDRVGMAYTFHLLGTIDLANRQVERATSFFAIAETLRPASGSIVNHPLTGIRKQEHAVDTARRRLGNELFAICWARGREMSLEQAIAFAQPTVEAAERHESLGTGRRHTEQLPDGYAGLTLREREVLQLLTQGLTYAQIADTLVISRRTVNAHVTSIYGKLGVTSRLEAGRFLSGRKSG